VYWAEPSLSENPRPAIDRPSPSWEEKEVIATETAPNKTRADTPTLETSSPPQYNEFPSFPTASLSTEAQKQFFDYTPSDSFSQAHAELEGVSADTGVHNAQPGEDDRMVGKDVDHVAMRQSPHDPLHGQSGQVVRVSISHDGEYAIASAIAIDETQGTEDLDNGALI